LTKPVFFPMDYLALLTIRHRFPKNDRDSKIFYHIPGGKAKQRLTKSADPPDSHSAKALVKLIKYQ
jgi:hypothetical protein